MAYSYRGDRVIQHNNWWDEVTLVDAIRIMAQMASEEGIEVGVVGSGTKISDEEFASHLTNTAFNLNERTELIYFPIELENHYTVAIFDLRKYCLFHYDPFNHELSGELQALLIQLHHNLEVAFDVSVEIRLCQVPPKMVQKDSHNCAVIVADICDIFTFHHDLINIPNYKPSVSRLRYQLMMAQLKDTGRLDFWVTVVKYYHNFEILINVSFAYFF